MHIQASTGSSVTPNNTYDTSSPHHPFRIRTAKNEPTEKQLMTFMLAPKVKEEFEKFCLQLDEDPYKNPEFFYKIAAQKLKTLLPKSLLDSLEKMSHGQEPGMILIDGFPIDSHIPTRSDYDDVIDRRDNKTHVSEIAMLAIASLMNAHLHSNPKEQQGAVVHQISPTKTKYFTASSQGAEPLIYHVENPFEKTPPKLVPSWNRLT